MRFVNKKTVSVAVVVGVIGGTIAAYAYFTSQGSGSGAASVGTATPWTVSGVSTTGGPLKPASGTETIGYTVTNSSSGQQKLNAVTVSVVNDGSGNVLNSASGDAAVAGCLVSWFSVDNSGAPSAANLAGGGSVTGSATVTMTDSGTSQDACQGVSPKLNVVAT